MPSADFFDYVEPAALVDECGIWLCYRNLTPDEISAV